MAKKRTRVTGRKLARKRRNPQTVTTRSPRTRTVAPKRTRRSPGAKAKSRTAESRSRSISALKGWRTRRATEKKRSAAARKGWETRRSRFYLRREKGKRSRTPGKPKPPAATVPASGIGTREFIGAADYTAKKRSSSVSIQISAFGPATATAKEAEHAIKERIATGHAPKGWNVRLIDWKSPHAWRQLSGPLKQAKITVE